jgi:XTP/dITP diphosphohydrolase
VNAIDAGSWVLASSNSGKLAEFRRLLSGTGIELNALEHPDSIPVESGTSFVENALIKARHASRLGSQPAIADDSGLCVDALAGAPGVHSARFAGPEASDSENIERLLAELTGIGPDRRGAEFHCVIVALRYPDDPAPIIATGRWRGRITTEPRGSNGFGYDPVFLDPALGLTAAELTAGQKDASSHRARACEALRRELGPG